MTIHSSLIYPKASDFLSHYPSYDKNNKYKNRHVEIDSGWLRQYDAVKIAEKNVKSELTGEIFNQKKKGHVLLQTQLGPENGGGYTVSSDVYDSKSDLHFSVGSATITGNISGKFEKIYGDQYVFKGEITYDLSDQYDFERNQKLFGGLIDTNLLHALENMGEAAQFTVGSTWKEPEEVRGVFVDGHFLPITDE